MRLAGRELLAAGLVPAGARLIRQGMVIRWAVFGGDEPYPDMLQGGLCSSLRLVRQLPRPLRLARVQASPDPSPW